MSEYIDRISLLRKREKIDDRYGVVQEVVYAQDVREAPAEDVAPVVHGRWVEIPGRFVSMASKVSSYSGNATRCSVCDEVNPNAFKTSYCPSCGARMDGEEKP